MPQPATAFVTPVDAPSWKRWLVYSAGARIVIFIALFIALSFAAGAVLHLLGLGKASPPLERAFGQFVIRALIPLLVYLILVKWIERRRSQSDSRAYDVSLTAKGLKLLRQVTPLVVESQSKLLEPLPPEQRQGFLRCLQMLFERA